MAAWHTQRLEALGARLDWSRCFVSVLFVDAQAPSYARARLAQRISDGAAAWNGLSRTLEFYACAHVAEAGGWKDPYVSPPEACSNPES